MEVTHHSDYDTHAIMGGGKTAGFGIINSAEFITVLSSTLYSDPFLAVCREVICNAWDAHKMVNKTDMSVEITLNQSELIIKDFGPGIDPAKMTEIYCTYGGSTKKNQENQTGGFGLGSKSPFAYTNYFTVTISYAGNRTIWALSRGSADTQGMPDLREIVTVPCGDETGVEVNIPLNVSTDVSSFDKVIRNVVAWGDMNVKLNGILLERVDFSQTTEGVIFTDRTPPSVNGYLYVQYGNVVYPIPKNREYEVLYDAAEAVMLRTGQKRNSWGTSGENKALHAVFIAGPNSFSISPSREALHVSDRTTNTIKKMLTNFINNTDGLVAEDVLLKHEKEIIQKLLDKGKDRRILMEDNLIQSYYANRVGEKYLTGKGTFHSIKDLSILAAARGFFFNELSLLMKARKQRFDFLLSNAGTKDKDLLLKLKNLLNRHPKLWTHNPQKPTGTHINFTKIMSRAASKGLNPKAFIMWDRHAYAGRKSYGGQHLWKTPDVLSNLTALTERKIMLVTVVGQITNHEHKHIAKVPDWDILNGDRVLIYQTNLKDYERDLKFFQNMKYQVVDIVKFYKEQYPPKPKPEKLKVIGGTKKSTFKKKKDTYPALSNLIINQGTASAVFDCERAKLVPDENTKMLSEYEFVAKGHSLAKTSYSMRFFSWGDAHARWIVEQFGDRTVVVKDSKTFDKLVREKGIKSLEDHIIKVMPDLLTSNEGLKTSRGLSKMWRTSPISEDTYRLIKEKTKVGALLQDIPVATEADDEVYNLFNKLSRLHRDARVKAYELKYDAAFETYQSWDKIENQSFRVADQFASNAASKLDLIDLRDIEYQLMRDEIEPDIKALIETLLISVLF